MMDEGVTRRQGRKSGFLTEKDAQRAGREALKAVEDGTHVAPSNMTVREFFDKVFMPSVRMDRKPTTIELYERTGRSYIVARIGDVALQKVDTRAVSQLYAALRLNGMRKRVGGLSEYTVHTVHIVLSLMMKEALAQGYIVRNPCATLPRSPGRQSREMETWSAEEAVVSLPPELCSLLKTHRARQAEERLAAGSRWQSGDLVFTDAKGAPYYPPFVTASFGKARKATVARVIRLHDLRHTFATLALQAGVHPKIVAEQLGHKNVLVTLNTYSHVVPQMSELAANAVADAIAKAGS
jgi:hypothetical protein